MHSILIQLVSPPILVFQSICSGIFVGVICAAIFYGVTILQTLFYFQTYPSDKMSLKSLVTGIWILDTLSFILASHGAYSLTIGYVKEPDMAHLNTKILWTIVVEPLCSSVLSLSVHLFMAYRIYVLKPQLVILATVIAAISFVPWGVTLATVILTMVTSQGLMAIHQKLRSPVIIYTVFMAAIDCFIAITMVVLLHKHDRGAVKFKRTNRMISTLTIYLISNNLLTSFITIAGAITFSVNTPMSMGAYSAVYVIISKAYTNTFLSLLNIRESIRGRGAIVMHSNADSVIKNMKEGGFNYGPSYRTTAEGLDNSKIEARPDEIIEIGMSLHTVTSD